MVQRRFDESKRRLFSVSERFCNSTKILCLIETKVNLSREPFLNVGHRARTFDLRGLGLNKLGSPLTKS